MPSETMTVNWEDFLVFLSKVYNAEGEITGTALCYRPIKLAAIQKLSDKITNHCPGALSRRQVPAINRTV